MERNEKRLTIPQAKKMVAELQAVGLTAAFNRMADNKMAVHIYENTAEWGMVATKGFWHMSDFQRFMAEYIADSHQSVPTWELVDA